MVQLQPVPLEALTFLGQGLVRLECVLATWQGDLYAADWRGGIAHLRPDGTQTLYAGALPDGRPSRPNGIALRPDGLFLLSDLGESRGGVFALARDGRVTPHLTEVDGGELPQQTSSHSTTHRAFGSRSAPESTRACSISGPTAGPASSSSTTAGGRG